MVNIVVATRWRGFTFNMHGLCLLNHAPSFIRASICYLILLQCRSCSDVPVAQARVPAGAAGAATSARHIIRRGRERHVALLAPKQARGNSPLILECRIETAQQHWNISCQQCSQGRSF